MSEAVREDQAEGSAEEGYMEVFKAIAGSPDLSHITEDLQRLAVPISNVVKDPGNLRLHSEKSVEAIRGSLAKFTQRKPIVVNKRTGVIEAGNGTLDALIANGMTHVAVVWVDDDPITATAFSIADNRTAELSEWDQPALAATLGALDYEVPGVDQEWLDSLEVAPVIEPTPPTPEPEPIEPPNDPVSKRGEIYQLGPHRLICGDARADIDWLKLLGERRATVVVTSPPYASQREYDESSGFKPVHPDKYSDWWEPLQRLVAEYLADDGSFFVNIKEHCDDGQRSLYVKDLVLAHVRKWGWQFVEEYIWSHGGTPKGPQRRFKNGWEPIFQFTRQYDFKWRPDAVMRLKGVVRGDTQAEQNAKIKAGLFGGGNVSNAQGKGRGRKASVQARGGANDEGRGGDGPAMSYPSNVLKLGKNREALGHSAAYPITLPEFFVKVCSDPGDLIVDPFLGSGSTLIAAARNGRTCFGFELSPGYCDVIRKRWGDWAKAAKQEPGEHAL